MKILLMGNPNVGKSVIFSALTGLNVMSANYPGTTVALSRGKTVIDGQEIELIDVPGTYGLDSGNPAERIANELLAKHGSGGVLLV